MSFLRTHIDNRSIFMLMLITLLCLSYLVCATTLTYAIPLGAVFIISAAWHIINGAALAYTTYTFIKSLIKSLEKQIAELEKEVPKLFKKKNELNDLYDARLGFMRNWERRLPAAESALTAAESATESAETAKSEAKSKYDKTAHYHDLAQTAYMTHSCSTCDQYGREYCPESIRLHNSWQSWASQMKTDKDAYETAKDTLKAKEKEERAAKSRVRKITDMKNHWERLANASLSKFRRVKKNHDEKKADLEQKRIELALKKAEIEVAIGNISGAKKELNDMQAQNPDAWTRVLDANPDLRAAIEEVLNYETD